MDTNNVGSEETSHLQELLEEVSHYDPASPWAFYAVVCTLVCAIIYLLWSL